MNETPRNEEETGGTAQPGDPLRSTEEEIEEGGLAARQNEQVQDEDEEDTEIEGEDRDKDEDTRQ